MLVATSVNVLTGGCDRYGRTGWVLIRLDTINISVIRLEIMTRYSLTKGIEGITHK